MKISTLAGALLGIAGATFHMAWNATAILPVVLYFLYFFFGGGFTGALIKGLAMWPSRILFIFLCWYLLFFKVDDQLFREIYIFHPFERHIIEGISLFFNVLAFCLFASLYQKKFVPKHIIIFAIFLIFTELVQYSLAINDNENPQLYAYMVYAFYPLIILDSFQKSKSPKFSLILLHSAVLFFLLAFVFSTRIPALGILVFLMGYLVYPWLRRRAIIYYFFVSSYIFSLLASIFLYVFFADVGLIVNYDLYSAENFGKGIDGRSFIWPDLLLKIFENPWLGNCSNCSTEYFENILGGRNLSSHNTFLEIAFRGGGMALALIIILFYSIFIVFRGAHESSSTGRFGFAYLLAVLLFMNSNEFGFSQTFTANIFFWCVLGILFSRCISPATTVKVRKVA